MRKFVFVHLPKTAGTSLHDALRRTLGPRLVSPSFIATGMRPAQAARLDRFAIVSGHISMADVQRFFPDREVLTILRDPVDRCLSWYYFARQETTAAHSGDFEAAKRYDVEAFFELDYRIIFRNVYNRQVRQLGDHVLNLDVDFERATASAKEVLRHAVWVGRQETLDADIEELGRRVPDFADLRIPKLNATGARRSASDLKPKLIERVRELNAYDVDLYAFASRQLA